MAKGKNSGYITKKVIELLSSSAESRDEFMLVIKHIHDYELFLKKLDKTQYYDEFFFGSLTNVRSIHRVWQKVQEEHPQLRCKEWEERQAQAGIIAKSIVNNQLTIF